MQSLSEIAKHSRHKPHKHNTRYGELQQCYLILHYLVVWMGYTEVHGKKRSTKEDACEVVKQRYAPCRPSRPDSRGSPFSGTCFHHQRRTPGSFHSRANL